VFPPDGRVPTNSPSKKSQNPLRAGVRKAADGKTSKPDSIARALGRRADAADTRKYAKHDGIWVRLVFFLFFFGFLEAPPRFMVSSSLFQPRRTSMAAIDADYGGQVPCAAFPFKELWRGALACAEAMDFKLRNAGSRPA